MTDSSSPSGKPVASDGTLGARSNPDLKRVPPTTILLCRHGETDWNLEKRFQGHEDVPLNDEGRRQADQMAAALRPKNLAAVVSSPLQRARETAGLIARASGLSISQDARLIERDLGLMQGLTSSETRSQYPEFWKAWKHTGIPFPPNSGVENSGDAVARIECALFDLAATYPGKTVAVVSHGALARVLLHRAVGTASITTLVVGPGRSWRLAKFNDADHLGGLRGLGYFQDADSTDWGKDQSTTTVVLCRHGETSYNRAGRFQGVEDVPLNDVGCEQGLLLAKALAAEDLSAIWASPLLRARETAIAVAAAAHLQLHLDNRLKARHLGVMQGRTPAELEQQHPEVMRAWRRQCPMPSEASVETTEDVVARIESALYAVGAAYPGKKVAFVTHAEIIRCLLKRVVNTQTVEKPEHVSLTALIVGPGRQWHLSQVSDSSNVPETVVSEQVVQARL
eukprot:TRINITY_DN81493_c0_g1_i1.p1 TRINITY_DN81493_c0_g1~~TRINITY_DN81493_c0_g1_i1.p1  ORF type:complete len:454 (-),score=72.05 TRINITY_DN81493_c0_g1_i1:76-1437(-)